MQSSILNVFRRFSLIFINLFCLQFGCISYFLLNFDDFSMFFQSKIALESKKHKNVFFMFPRIKIHGRLTKNHELFWISCHLLPVSKRFSKRDIYLISLLSGRENHQKTQNFHFFDFLKFF